MQSLGSPAWGWGQGDGAGDKEESGCSPSGEGAGRRQRQEQQLVSFVLQLRQTLQDTRCSAMVTCPAGGFDGVGGGVKGTREWTACPAVGFDGVGGSVKGTRDVLPVGLTVWGAGSVGGKSCAPYY